ncbi:MAG: HD domain-containing protein, partial [Candidatus Limnocylindrus sp.]
MSAEPQPISRDGAQAPQLPDAIAKVRALARPVAELREKLLAKVSAHHEDASAATLVAAAFDFAVQAHGEQVRASGEPYVTHPAEASLILADLGLDATTLAAALLHDVPEDTGVTTTEIGERF